MFGTEVSVDDDIPALLLAVAHATQRTPEALLVDWARDRQVEPGKHRVGDADVGVELPPTNDQLPTTNDQGAVGDSRAGSDLLDVLQTLIEELVDDAERRLGTYPEGRHALASAEQLFDRLRQLIAPRSGV
jgi:hypothetical protein